MNERIDTLETIYNVAKIIEGGRNAIKGYWGNKEITKGAIKYSDKIATELRGFKADQNALIRKASNIRRFLNKYMRSSVVKKAAARICLTQI